MTMHRFHAYPSSYLAAIVWGAAGFMGQPTFASFMVHFAILPCMLLLILWLAHWEGRNEAKS
jgi:hypothetical protein